MPHHTHALLHPPTLPHPTSLPCRGTWKTQEFKEYNFEAKGRLPAVGHLHPLLKVRCRRRGRGGRLGWAAQSVSWVLVGGWV